MEFRIPGEYASIGTTSGSPSQPEPYTCSCCFVPWPDGDPLIGGRVSQQIVGCPNCGNFEERREIHQSL
jgi:hypothetical protein